MPAALKTTVTELGDSRVRVDVEVPADELEGRLERKATQLGRQLKLPGFRRGKVPAPLVIQRIGREAVLEEAVRETLSSWYSDAIESSGIVPVGDPQLDLGELPDAGQVLAFSIEIGVLPKAKLGDYRSLEAARREPEVGEEQIDAEVEGIRERLARLETAERPAAEGDFVVVDYVGSIAPAADTQDASAADAKDAPPADAEDAPAADAEDAPGADAEDAPSGDAQQAPSAQAAEAGGQEGAEGFQAFAGGEGRDQLIELGSGNLIPGFEEGLLGAGAGDQRTVRVRFPDDYAARELAGREASFEVSVKEVKLKQLPAVDDDLAADAGFEDLQELRDDIRARLLEVEEQRAEAEFRQAALDAAVASSEVEVTPELTAARAREMWERMLHSLGHRGITRESYLRVVGRDEADILKEMEPEAEQALRREAVITAIVAAEELNPSDEELLEALRPTAEREESEPQELLEALRKNGRLEEAREDLAARQAIDLIASLAKPIAPERAQAREQLWTPAKAAAAGSGAGADEEAAPGKLWTPSDPAAGS